MNLNIVFENAVRRFPHHIAVDDGARQFTYEHLSERTSRLGTALSRLGMRKGDRIASLQYNSVEVLEVDVASARFGYVRTLLNPRSDLQTHQHSIQDCGAKVLFFGGEFADLVNSLRGVLPQVEAFVAIGHAPDWALSYEEFLATAAANPPTEVVSGKDWHSVYYTSGTTGKPKGVVLTQTNWLALVRNHLVDVFPRASASDVVLHAASMSHASGAFNFAHLARGARQRILSRFEPDEVLDVIERERVTTMFLAPVMIMKLLDADAGRSRDKASLHSVIYGGGPMPAERVGEAVRAWGSVFAQGYGQWEAPQMVTFLSQDQHREALDSNQLHRFSSAGRPLSFTQVAILDDEGQILPTGAEGEIATAGDHVMEGYLNQPEETAALRVGPWQRSGDIGRIDGDGFVYLTDRKKDLIVTGGSNVYPREIEEVLYRHPDVHEAVAVGVPDDTWGEHVHALVVARQDRAFDSTAFLAWCQERLSSDKRPRSVELVKELPKSFYGKILRRELRARYWQSSDRKI